MRWCPCNNIRSIPFSAYIHFFFFWWKRSYEIECSGDCECGTGGYTVISFVMVEKRQKITPWGYSSAFSLIHYFTNNLVEEMKVFAGHYITQLTDCLRT